MVLAVGSLWEEALTSRPHSPMLCPAIAELAAVFKTDAALSRVLPNPWSPAGYFPSEAIYLLPFQMPGFCLSSLVLSLTWEGAQSSQSSQISGAGHGVRPHPGEERQLWRQVPWVRGWQGSIDSFPIIV